MNGESLYADCRNPACLLKAWRYDAGRLGYCRACRATLRLGLVIGLVIGLVAVGVVLLTS